MKTPKEDLAVRKCRSVLDQTLEKIAPGQFATINSEAGDRLQISYKSETNIDRNSMELWSDTNSSHSQLIPETLKRPKEMLRKSLIKLKSNQCSVSVKALRNIVQISRSSPRLLAKSMPPIYKGITALLKSLRLTVARTACQAAEELFMNVPSVQGAEFDELIHVLLQKTVKANAPLRKDAFKALESMIIYVPPVHSLGILLHSRIAGYGEGVRTTAAKLLACVVSILGTDSSIVIDEETKTRLVVVGLGFLRDDCNCVKYQGSRLVKMLMQGEGYRRILQKKVGSPVLQKINKIGKQFRGTPTALGSNSQTKTINKFFKDSSSLACNA